MEDDFKFEIGATYKNMKGAFEVISIRSNAMVIRWDNGRQIDTTVELQKRILERMDHEKQVAASKKTKPKKSTKSKAKPKPAAAEK